MNEFIHTRAEGYVGVCTLNRPEAEEGIKAFVDKRPVDYAKVCKQQG